MDKLVAAFIEDVNKEDGVTITFFTKMTNVLFIIIMLLSIPLFIYCLSVIDQ